MHYLPHHAVVRQDKETTKVMVVYDTSAKSGGAIPQQLPFHGPQIQSEDFGYSTTISLLPWIEVPVGGWVDDITKPNPEVRVLRFTRVMFGVSSSPFLLNATIDHHLKLFSSAKLRCLKRFVARRGLPRRIVSDNAQTFKCAAKTVQAMLSQQGIQQYLSDNGIWWKRTNDQVHQKVPAQGDWTSEAALQ